MITKSDIERWKASDATHSFRQQITAMIELKKHEICYQLANTGPDLPAKYSKLAGYLEALTDILEIELEESDDKDW